MMKSLANEETALPLKDALALFDQLADLDYVAFGYPHNGCSARAHIMCTIMSDAGLTPAKVWAFETNNKMLEVTLYDNGPIRWSYHVAPVLPVQMPDDAVQNLVFDPSLFDGPVSLQEWAKIMVADETGLQVTRKNEQPRDRPGFYDNYVARPERADRSAQILMSEYLDIQKLPRRVFPSQTRRQFAEAPQRGKTWNVIAAHPPLPCPAHNHRKVTP